MSEPDDDLTEAVMDALAESLFCTPKGLLTGAQYEDVFDAARAAVLAVAAHMADGKADAWDAGQQAGFRFYREHVPFAERDPNPFRLTPDTEGDD